MEEDRKKLVEKSLKTNRILMGIISIPYSICFILFFGLLCVYLVLAFVTGFFYYTEGMSPAESISFVVSGDLFTTVLEELIPKSL